MATLKCMQPQTASIVAIVRDVNSNSTAELGPCSRPSFLSAAKRHHFSKLEIILALLSLLLLVALIVTSVLVTRKKSKPTREDGPTRAGDAIESLAQILGNMDNNADPCEDFYQYACGGWMRKTHLDDSDLSLMLFQQVQKENRRVFKEILENYEIGFNYSNNEAIAKVFDMYSSCMNRSALDQTGASELSKLLQELAVYNITRNPLKATDHRWQDVVIKVKRKIGIDTFFNLVIWDDLRNSSTRRIVMTWVELGLDYGIYTSTNFSRTEKLKREYYVDYMTDLMQLATSGNRSSIREEMKKVLELESSIAKTQLPPHQRNNISLIYNVIPIEALANKTSQFDWLSFFRKLTAATGYTLESTEQLLITSPKMIQELITLLNNTDSSVISNYIAWKIVSNLIDVLPQSYRRAYRKYLSRNFTNELQETPRWSTCVQAVVSNFPVSSALLFTDQALTKGSVQKVKTIAREVQETLLRLIPNQEWLDEKSRRGASDKVKAMLFDISYPETIVAGSLRSPNFTVSKTSYFTTNLNVRSFNFMKSFKSLKTTVNRTEFLDKDPLKPAPFFYHTRNKFEIPAAFLRKPLYNMDSYKSYNFGGIGMVIGHEMTHGFDWRGREFDKIGRQRKWMSTQSAENLKNRSLCLYKQFNAFKYKNQSLGVSLNKIREAFCDTGGLKLAFEAYKKWKTQNDEEPIVAGLKMTHNQLFFLSFAQAWCQKTKVSALLRQVRSGKSIPFSFRVKGSLMNSRDFADAFSCRPGSRMNPVEKCEVW